MQVVLNTDPSAPARVQRGAVVVSDLSGPLRIVRLDQSLQGPSEVLVLANRAAIEEAGLKWNGK